MPRGKPLTKTQRKVAIEFLLDEVSSGNFLGPSIIKLLARKKLSVSRQTWWRWCDEDDDLNGAYTRARKRGAEALFETVLDIAANIEHSPDPKMRNALIQEARLKIDTLKWVLPKMDPSAYSDFSRRSLENPDGSGILSELADALREVSEEESF